MNLLQFIQSHLAQFVTDLLRLCLWLALLAALFIPLERRFGQAHGPLPRGHLLTSVAYYFISSLVPAMLLSVPLLLLAQLFNHIVPAALPAAMAALPLAAKLALAFLIGEIGFYWGHRVCHHSALLWRFHAIHHSTEQLDYLANTRNHPIDMVVTRLFGLVPLYLLGLAGPSASGTATPVALVLFGTVWSFFIHANLRWRFGPLEWLIATPAFHHWHHSRIEHINRNYASTLPVLDRIFGTHYLPATWPSAYGIEASMPATLGGQLLAPLRRDRPAPPAAAAAAPVDAAWRSAPDEKKPRPK